MTQCHHCLKNNQYTVLLRSKKYYYHLKHKCSQTPTRLFEIRDPWLNITVKRSTQTNLVEPDSFVKDFTKKLLDSVNTDIDVVKEEKKKKWQRQRQLCIFFFTDSSCSVIGRTAETQGRP